jgi:hypothetical protein
MAVIFAYGVHVRRRTGRNGIALLRCGVRNTPSIVDASQKRVRIKQRNERRKYIRQTLFLTSTGILLECVEGKI